MKITVEKPVEIEVDAMRITLPVRFEEEDIPNDFPMREGDTWKATVEIDTGKIRDWPLGKSGNIFMKVCDSGVYELLDGEKVIATREDYVPNCIPQDCGDYVEFEIDESGIIKGWAKTIRRDVASAFFWR